MAQGFFHKEQEDPTIAEVIGGIALAVFLVGSVSLVAALLVFAWMFGILFAFLIAIGASELIAFLIAYGISIAAYFGVFCGLWSLIDAAIKQCTKLMQWLVTMPKLLISTVSTWLSPIADRIKQGMPVQAAQAAAPKE